MDEVWPLVLQRRPARPRGDRRPQPAGAARTRPHARGFDWTFTGFVDDVRPYVAAAHAYAIPLRVGSGTRIKVFEAMAMGCPVVSTRLGAEGLDVVDEEHFLAADTAPAFADALLRLLDDPGAAAPPCAGGARPGDHPVRLAGGHQALRADLPFGAAVRQGYCGLVCIPATLSIRALAALTQACIGSSAAHLMSTSASPRRKPERGGARPHAHHPHLHPLARPKPGPVRPRTAGTLRRRLRQGNPAPAQKQEPGPGQQQFPHVTSHANEFAGALRRARHRPHAALVARAAPLPLHRRRAGTPGGRRFRC